MDISTSEVMAELAETVFSVRLDAGKFVWFGARPALAGTASFVQVPSLLSKMMLSYWFGSSIRKVWVIDPLNKSALGQIGEARVLERIPADPLAEKAWGIIRLDDSNVDGQTSLSIFLSPTDIDHTGLSTFERWAKLIESCEGQTGHEPLLRLRFTADAQEVLTALSANRVIATTHLELEIPTHLPGWRI